MASENRFWTYNFVLAISLSRIGIGLFQSISGPTLPVLAKNVGQDPKTVSWIFTGQAIGFVIGSILAPITSQKFDGMLQLAVSLAVCGVSLGVMPFIVDFWLLIIIIAIGGIIVGFNDAIIQQILLRVWGEEDSASILQLHHFTYSIGAFIAPLLVSPFYGAEEDVDELCNRVDENDDNSGNGDSGSDIWIPYLICFGYIIAVVLYMVVLYCKNIISRLNTSHSTTIDTRPEDSARTLILYFIPLSLFYFAIVGGESTFYTNIFSYATCAANLPPGDSAVLNALFWAGFGLGRASGIFMTKFIKPALYILIDSVGVLVASTLLVIYDDEQKMLWAMTFLFGFFIATFYSCGMSYTHSLTNVSNKWIFVFGIGNTIGAMSMPLLGSQLVFSDSPISFMWLLVGLSLFAAVSFGFMHMFGFYIGPLPKVRKERKNNKVDPSKDSELPDDDVDDVEL